MRVADGSGLLGKTLMFSGSIDAVCLGKYAADFKLVTAKCQKIFFKT